MKRVLFLVAICVGLMITPLLTEAQSSGGSGMSVTCTDGSEFDNGVEIVVSQMRSGFTYTATAIGLNGFDPVLAVLDTKTGNGLCNDDEPDASNYAANLPTTGYVPASGTSGQVRFNQNISKTF